ncbi:alpha/beta hydrolase [Bradyrhizobium sp. INPA03-11B]|uniref:alpha/beta fold hydrolase n=1 Tax=Bradyrhizobium sp. INPA03-11B TaxID=418598 RepID=UPI00338D8ACD
MSDFHIPGSGFARHHVTVDRYNILYAVAGEGPTLVSVPGSAGAEMSTAKDLLARRFKVIELNPPGFGPNDDLLGTIDHKELASLLGRALEAMGEHSYHVLGTSIGGFAAMWLALERHKETLSLTLEAPMNFLDASAARSPEMFHTFAALGTGSVRLADVLPMIDKSPAPSIHPRKPWADVDFFREQMRNRLRLFQHLVNLHDEELKERVRTLKCPIMWILSEQDEVIHPHAKDQFLQYAPLARTELWPEGTHDLQNTQPERFAESVTRFIGELG